MTEAISLESRRPLALQRRLMHRGVKYDSYPEVLFAQALEAAQVTYIPQPRICVSSQSRPRVDFLVLHRGRALVIEIHGRTYHPANRMLDEWNRTRPLKMQGVEIDFIDAQDVLEDPDAAVARALELLAAA